MLNLSLILDLTQLSVIVTSEQAYMECKREIYMNKTPDFCMLSLLVTWQCNYRICVTPR